MSKFKVGDKVKLNKGSVIRNCPDTLKGREVHTVEHVRDSGGICSIKLNGFNVFFTSWAFDLASEPPFTINPGDYIDSREFTREECERFCELAVECGFGRGEWMEYFGDFENIGVGSLCGSIYHCDGKHGSKDDFNNNITTQFREFLDKEKVMSEWETIEIEPIQKDGDTFKSNEFIASKGDKFRVQILRAKPEPKEMTVADIERELGYSVKVVK